MKKLLSIVFACALAFGTMMPIYAEEAAVVVSQEDLTALKNGSIASLQESTDAFYALSLLANGADETKMKAMESSTLNVLEEAAAAPRATSQDIEKLILIAEGLGYDATKYELNGKTVNLFDSLEGKTIALVNDYVFALEAIHSADATIAANSKLNKDDLIQKMLGLRNPTDHAWNWNANYTGEYGISDSDTTAMALTALAPYANNSAERMGISAETKAAVDAAVVDGFTYLSSKQGVSGAMDNGYGENASSTAVTIVALSAYGKDARSDAQFVKEGKNLVDGLMKFKNADNLGFEVADWQTGEMKLDLGFGTEQGLRALIALENTTAGTPYYLYQAGAVANQDRFKKEPVTEPEKEPVTVPEKETKPEAEKKPEKESIIKNTAKQSQEGSAIFLLIIAGAGVCVLRKYA